MKKTSILTLLALAAIPGAASAANLLSDGSFELSGSAARNPLSAAWTTDLGVRLGPGNASTDPGSLYDESTYVVANGISPFDVHNLFRKDLAAQSGTKYMIVNGSTNPAKRVLQLSTSVPVVGGSTYYFQGYAASVYPDATADLTFKVDYLDASSNVVNSTSGLLTAPSIASGWQLIGFNSVAGMGSLTARLTITNSETAATGNDFALDSLSFSTQPVPEPTTVAALGLGVLGLARRRRRA